MPYRPDLPEKNRYIFDEDKLEWQCLCGIPIEELELKVTYYHSLSLVDNTAMQFEITNWDIGSALCCQKCKNLYTEKVDYELKFNDDGFVGIQLIGGDE
jgi:hypothetical protein